jgi:MarR family transcriptional regulator, organic hydroperoxide resistance regulator
MNARSSEKVMAAGTKPAPAPSPNVERYATTPAAQAWALLTRVFFEHGKPRMMAVTSEFELSPQQAVTLRLLDEPRPMGELAVQMHCDNSNMTGIVDRLEERGLVFRGVAEHDRRVKLIALTDEGRKIRDELDRRMAEPPEAIAKLSAADHRALRDILTRALGDE